MSELAAALARRRSKLSEAVTTSEDIAAANNNNDDEAGETRMLDESTLSAPSSALDENNIVGDNDNDASRYEQEEEQDGFGNAGDELLVEVEEGDELGVKCVPLQYESSTLACEGLYVIQVKDSTSGFRQGDKIIAVNGHSITDLLTDDALLTLQTSFKRTLSVIRQTGKSNDDKETLLLQSATETHRKTYDEYLLPTDSDSYSYKYDETSVSHEWKKRKRHYSRSLSKKLLYNGLGEAVDVPTNRACEPTMINKVVNKVKPPAPIVDITTDVYHQNMRRLRRRVSERT